MNWCVLKQCYCYYSDGSTGGNCTKPEPCEIANAVITTGESITIDASKWPYPSVISVPSCSPIITQYDRLMAEMTVEYIAKYRTSRIKVYQVDDYAERYDNDAGKFWNYDKAIAAEIEYLKSEVPHD